ncbi:MAG: YaiO family outer membrane beta-barrel protein [Immundisolibacteraceae bacterium]|nr:YaiO family outer membrane beta-barrel protein [Immundisolibacteraceae bacterium]
MLAPNYLDVLQVLTQAHNRAGNLQQAKNIKRQARSIAPDALWAQVDERENAAFKQAGRLLIGFTSDATRTEQNDTWHESAINIEYAWSRTERAGFRAARSIRFGQRDTLYELFATVPVTNRISVTGRGQFSPSHRVRPEKGGFLEASLILNHGWVISLGGGQTTYSSGPSDKVSITVERYFSHYRLAYTETAVQPDGGPWSPAHRLSGSWYYGGDNRINLNLAFGEETDETVTGTRSLKFDTWGAGIGGRHWLNAEFAIDYSAGYEGLESNRGEHLDRTTFYAGIVFRI